MRFGLESLDIFARAAVLSRGTISMPALSMALKEESEGSTDFKNRYAFQARWDPLEWNREISWDAKSGWDGVSGLPGFDSLAELLLNNAAKANGATVMRVEDLASAARQWEEISVEIDRALDLAGNLSTDDGQ